MKRIYLEISNACNLDCPFCTVKKGHDFMSLEEIESYTDQIREFCDYIYLHVLGEPLLHPDFERILDILDDKELSLQLVTNGTLLDKYPGILKHKCLRKLSVSLHAVNHLDIDDTYFKTIDRFIEEGSNVNIELRFYGKEDLDDKLRAYLSSLFERYHPKESEKRNSFRLKDKVYVYFDDFFDWPDINHDPVSDKGRCHGLIDQLAILCDGTVTSCCLDANAYNAFGTLKKNALKDILESERYVTALNDLKNGKLSLELCRRCRYRLRFDHNNN